MTAEEHLKQDVGALLTNLIFQNALLKADNDRLRETAAQPQPEPAMPNGAR
jgi:hypothetical protein